MRDTSTETPPGITTPRAANPIVMKSEQLFGDEREIVIAHGQETYRLRITRQGKLILTK